VLLIEQKMSLIAKFKNDGIIPDIFDEVENLEEVKVSYSSGVKVNSGSELTPTNVKDEPLIEWNAEDNSFYTLLMTGKNIF
jgi:phosphatidylethanolamine-binding protein